MSNSVVLIVDNLAALKMQAVPAQRGPRGMSVFAAAQRDSVVVFEGFVFHHFLDRDRVDGRSGVPVLLKRHIRQIWE